MYGLINLNNLAVSFYPHVVGSHVRLLTRPNSGAHSTVALRRIQFVTELWRPVTKLIGHF